MRSTYLAVLGWSVGLWGWAGVWAPEVQGADQISTLAGEAKINFGRDVRPILADNCFQCHGPDNAARQAGLRLDSRDAATTTLKSGNAAIVPGDIGKSALVARISSADENFRMPPPDSLKHLTPQEKETLKQWITEGAGYQKHWAFNPPVRPPLPKIRHVDWVQNGIDYFVANGLEKLGLAPSPQASKTTLIRRVSLDLTGLPPTKAEVDAFLADDSPKAYEELVDRLLGSSRYGERMAVDWLDAARYADTNGYNNDTPRFMWRWRDWVIDAFNRNLPFDRFVVEQLAGDLLPNPTLPQKIATGFNRNHVITSEGGIIDEEYRLEYVADRVHTTATVFMGLSMRCARCHEHKFDPITQDEYYRFFAFFNNVPEKGYDGRYGNAVPMIEAPLPDQAQRQKTLQIETANLTERLKKRRTEAAEDAARWEAGQLAETAEPVEMPTGMLAHYALDASEGTVVANVLRDEHHGNIIGNPSWEAGRFGGALALDGKTHVSLGQVGRFERTETFSLSAWVYPLSKTPGAVLAKMDDAAAHRGYDLLLEDEGKVAMHLIHQWPDNGIKVKTKKGLKEKSWHHVCATYAGSSEAAGVRIYVDGVLQELTIEKDALSETIQTDKPFHLGRRNPGTPLNGKIDDVRIYARLLSGSEVEALAKADPIRSILALAEDRRAPSQTDQLFRHYLENVDAEYKRLSAENAKLSSELDELNKRIPKTMVMQDMDKRRATFVLARGQYDRPGAEVKTGVPASLPAFDDAEPGNRLGLARWLVKPNHPLTSRVAVNRFWQMYFGIGLVKTAEDFGVQGEWPSHPALLDWLATEFVRTGWDVKGLQKLIVTSATYRQSSKHRPELAAVDPNNRLLGRGPRFRMPAEMLRDNALFISGLLHEQLGGPSVKPYQPPGLWRDVSVGNDSYSGGDYKQDDGPGLYRRSVYTHWKRTCPPPSLNTFDAPEREFCTIRRSVTNTPLQALILWNDPTYVEAARRLAQRAILEAGPGSKDRVNLAFQLATARIPDEAERAALEEVLASQLNHFRQTPEAARDLLAVGKSRPDERIEPAELASWTVVASMILTLDETITKG